MPNLVTKLLNFMLFELFSFVQLFFFPFGECFRRDASLTQKLTVVVFEVASGNVFEVAGGNETSGSVVAVVVAVVVVVTLATLTAV